MAASQPARVAAEFGDDFVTYGRLHTVIETYQSVTAAQGLGDKAAVYAAVVHCLPGLSAVNDAYTMAGEVASILRQIEAADTSQVDAPETGSARTDSAHQTS
jgi:mevalonate pyrophosphate decarboxylase